VKIFHDSPLLSKALANFKAHFPQLRIPVDHVGTRLRMPGHKSVHPYSSLSLSSSLDTYTFIGVCLLPHRSVASKITECNLKVFFDCLDTVFDCLRDMVNLVDLSVVFDVNTGPVRPAPYPSVRLEQLRSLALQIKGTYTSTTIDVILQTLTAPGLQSLTLRIDNWYSSLASQMTRFLIASEEDWLGKLAAIKSTAPSLTTLHILSHQVHRLDEWLLSLILRNCLSLRTLAFTFPEVQSLPESAGIDWSKMHLQRLTFNDCSSMDWSTLPQFVQADKLIRSRGKPKFVVEIVGGHALSGEDIELVRARMRGKSQFFYRAKSPSSNALPTRLL